MKTALLLIDLQNDFLLSPSLEPHRSFVTRNAARLLNHARSHGMPVIHVYTTIRKDGENRMPHWKDSGKWACVEGTEGQATPPSLIPSLHEAVVNKSFFSAFCAAGNLQSVLLEAAVDTLWIAGVHLHGCIRSTALDAYERGFRVIVADDAVGSDDPVHAQITRRYLQRRSIRFASVDDLSDEKCLHVTSTSDSNVATAVSSAEAAAGGWRDRHTTDRLEALERLAVAIEQQSSELTETIVSEVHKPVRYASDEVLRSSELIRAICASLRFDIASNPDSGGQRVAPGTFAIITPWNNPLAIPVGKIAAALAFGNAVVWKPSPRCPAVSSQFMALCSGAGIPANVLQLVEGGNDVAETLMENPSIDGVSITGSLQAGRAAQEITARRMVPLQAELGGNNAAIIWDDCDLAEAAWLVAEGAFGFAGQRCTANRRAVVSASCFEAFLDHLVAATGALVVGSVRDPKTVVGPMIDERALLRVSRLLEATRSRFRTIVPHSPAQTGQGAFFPPTIVLCDDPEDEIVQEETFGPVLVLQRAETWDAAMSLCNGVRQGLAASLFSTNRDLQKMFVDGARAGIMKLNLATAGADAELPFGGWKLSGIGPPEHGPGNREFYLRWQSHYRKHDG